jgi:DNA gyrase subunit A
MVFGDGSATRIPLEVFPVQGRGGMGAIAFPDEERETVRALDVDPGETLIALSAAGRSLRLPVDEVASQEGGHAGTAVLPVGGYDRIVEVTRLAEPASRSGAEPPEGDLEEDGEVGDTDDVAVAQEEAAKDAAETQLEILA